MSNEQKKELFRESQQSPHPFATPPPGHPSKNQSHHKKHHPSSETSQGHSPSKHHHPTPSPTPVPAKHDPVTPGSNPSAAIPAHSTITLNPPPVTPSSSLSLPHGATPSAPITIEKSGIEQAEGEEPASPAPTGLFGWLFGGGGSTRSYNYLRASTRAAIDHAHVRRGRWKYIIVHNSGTREGNARVFDIYHLRVRHMVNGLAYHFVIGDGHGSGDGQIEIGHRWTAQLNGGHVASDYLNDISLGICLVGDFNRDLPTKAQIGALEELIDYLRNRVGKTQGRRAIVYAHKEINPRPTDCPGERFPYSWLHAKFR
jgi:hypothetical protein